MSEDRGVFEIKKITNLSELGENGTLPTSDLAILSDNKYYQFNYKNKETELPKYKVKPGIFTIAARGQTIVLNPTEFVKDRFLPTYNRSVEVTGKVDIFFSRLDVYAKHGIEVPRMSILVYGPPGTGKTSSMSIIAEKYNDGKTAIIVWPTDQFEAGQVKSFFKSFKYVGVERVIFFAEDLGGTEMDQSRMRSDSSLLSLLDNQEKTFTLPTVIISTTNFPEMFLGNITNRPGRFDVKIEVGTPTGEERKELLKFFLPDANEEALSSISDPKCDGFSVAHIKHCVIYADLYNITVKEMVERTQAEIKTFKNDFQRSKTMGFNYDDE